MAGMLCPHGCGVTFDKQGAQYGDSNIGIRGATVWKAIVWFCPNCGGLVVDLDRFEPPELSTQQATVSAVRTASHRVWPRSHRQPPPQVPAELARDFTEAAATLDLSPRASAALSRRCLQHVLVDHLGATGRDLNKQIDSVVQQVPSHLADDLHALRHIGNFAAHPIKAQSTGDVVDVEPGEAEWSLDVLEGLFDFVFVAPAKAQTRKAALNQKLTEAGKPQLP